MPNSSGMEHSSGKRVWEWQGIWEWELSSFLAMEMQQAPSPCINHGKSLWLWHYRDELDLDANGQTRKKNARYRNSSYTLVAEGGLYKGCGASRKEMGTEKKKPRLFKTALPQWSRMLLHTHAHRTQLPAKALSPMGFWLPCGCKAKCTQWLQNTENRSHLLTG